MRKAFTLVELMVSIAIIGIVAGMIIPVITLSNSSSPGTNPSPKVDLKIDGNTFTVQKITFDGHSYLFIDGRSRTGWDVEHNPDCPKCHPVTVKEMKVEGQ